MVAITSTKNWIFIIATLSLIFMAITFHIISYYNSSNRVLQIDHLNSDTLRSILGKYQIIKDVNSLDGFKDNLIFDKLFSNVLKPTKLEPFYFKMSSVPKVDDVTVTTMITVDRFNTLLNSISTTDCYFSVTLHIPDDEELVSNMEKLTKFIDKNFVVLKSKTNIHLVIDKYPRQLNYLRNVARFFSKTEIIFPLDVDFIVNKSFLKNFKSNEFVKSKLSIGNSVFVLPALEFQNEYVNTKFNDFPQTKEEVISMFNNSLTVFHGLKNRGHSSTNYEKWLGTDRIYQIVPDTLRYEPYALFNTTGVPYSDERFTGYGANKVAWWYEIYLSGVEFYVLPNDFVIHCFHEYPDIRIEEVSKQ